MNDNNDYAEITLFGKTVTGWRAKVIALGIIAVIFFAGYASHH